MDTREITIKVNAEAAYGYAAVAAAAEEREKIDLLLSLRLSQVTGPSASLEQITRETSQAARARGLTESELDGLFVRSDPRCVFDTIVLVSALLFDAGKPAQAFFSVLRDGEVIAFRRMSSPRSAKRSGERSSDGT